MIKGLHHNAYRCRDSEETRRFYEDFLGLKLVSAFEIGDGMGLHTFFAMDDGSCLAFFEVPDRPFEFKRQDDLCKQKRPFKDEALATRRTFPFEARLGTKK